MIKIFTTPTCSSCKKAKEWLNQHHIPYEEVKLFSTTLTNFDVLEMLKNADNGFEDIISTRSKYLKENHINVDDLKFNELIDLIKREPSILKRPIIISDDRMQVGYNEEDIRIFVSKEEREKMMCVHCAEGKDCDYCDSFLQEIEEVNHAGTNSK